VGREWRDSRLRNLHVRGSEGGKGRRYEKKPRLQRRRAGLKRKVLHLAMECRAIQKSKKRSRTERGAIESVLKNPPKQVSSGEGGENARRVRQGEQKDAKTSRKCAEQRERFRIWGGNKKLSKREADEERGRIEIEKNRMLRRTVKKLSKAKRGSS